MKLHDAIATGITHLSKNLLRSGLSILGTSIGVASVLCMIAVGDGAKEIVSKDIEALGVQTKSISGPAHPFGNADDSKLLMSDIHLKTHERLKQNVRMFYYFCRKMNDTVPISLAAKTVDIPVHI